MGNFKEEHGKTRVGMVLKSLGKIVPDILDVATSGSPMDMLAKAKNLILNKQDISQQDKDIVLAQIETARLLEVARLNDMASARNREIELAKAGKKDWMMSLVGITVLALLVVSVLTVFFFDIKNKDMGHLILGEVLGFGSGMIFYYFGTSKSSSDKNQLLKR